MRVTGYNINVVNYQLLEDIVTTLCEDSDNTFCHSDVIRYVTNSDDIFSYRYTMFYDIVKSFCHFNANLLINIINHDDTINTTYRGQNNLYWFIRTIQQFIYISSNEIQLANNK